MGRKKLKHRKLTLKTIKSEIALNGFIDVYSYNKWVTLNNRRTSMIQVGDTFKSKDGRVNNIYVVTKVDETDNATYVHVADVESKDKSKAYGSKVFKTLYEPLN